MCKIPALQAQHRAPPSAFATTAAAAEMAKRAVSTTTASSVTGSSGRSGSGDSSGVGRGVSVFSPTDEFARRHIGPSAADQLSMLEKCGFGSLEELLSHTLPPDIRLPFRLPLEPALSESEALSQLREMMAKNRVLKSFIGMGYHETLVPSVIQRNVLENPGWYTAYTPYQAEISQGRLQSLLNYQTMVADLTGRW